MPLPIRRAFRVGVIVCGFALGCASRQNPVAPELHAASRDHVPAGIALLSPRPWAVIESPLHVDGKADPGWFFEGSCGLRLVASDGTPVATRYVVAEGESPGGPGWRRFRGTIEFDVPAAGYGSIVLTHESADTGYPLREFRMPVRFRDYE